MGKEFDVFLIVCGGLEVIAVKGGLRLLEALDGRCVVAAA
jgi:hypothetical protein